MKGKKGSYYKYAFGEIILLVLGILIALSINNWNEERKNSLIEKKLILNIIKDLRLDSIYISQSLVEVNAQKKVIDDIISMSLNKKNIEDYSTIGLLRYSSDFRPITQRNHSVSISNMGSDEVREKIQNYFIEEDRVLDIFLEYVDIVHNKVRPYLSETGMHNLESIYKDKSSVNLKKDVLISQLPNVKFQQILYERRLKTDSFERFLNILKNQNQLLIDYLSSLD
tara:strand:- start:155 stop:832 length:678 start_codon:yes stop_codon:yes gene_type:complete